MGEQVPDTAAVTEWHVDPFAITDFARSEHQLEALLVFCIAVAGKKATGMAPKVQQFLSNCPYEGGPFDRIRNMLASGTLEDNLRRVRMGKYTLLTRAFKEILERGLVASTVSVGELERIHGIASKTARFFVLHSRPHQRIAVIDTHLLKYLRTMGVPKVPPTVPKGKNYDRLERLLLAEADRLQMPMCDFDLKVWSWYASGNKGTPSLSPSSKAADEASLITSTGS